MNQKDKFIATSNYDQTKKFCPLINDTCRIDCECFISARVEPESAEITHQAYCNNVMFDRDLFTDLQVSVRL